MKLAHSSGNSEADEAATKAVHNSSPFQPVPTGYPFDVSYMFDLNTEINGSFRSF
jgi:outer membrane biosynthesis protein TonB